MSNENDGKKRDELARVTGSTTNLADANDRMKVVHEKAHLVSPATSVNQLPEGCSIAFNLVQVNVGLDTYSTGGGKHGLSKTVLDRLAAAVGISWDPHLSGRLDNGRHPHFCHWKAVGRYRAFDGTWQYLVSEKVMDFREGSPHMAGKSDTEIRETRKHLPAHCETKARLRAIRSFGIKTSYTQEELQKPFVSARVMFTGETRDPQLKREFAHKIADSFLESSRGLYGPSAPQLSSGAEPPPVGALSADADSGDYDVDVDNGDTGCARESVAPATTAGGHGGDEPPRDDRKAAPASARVWKIPGGKEKDKTLVEASDGTLEYWEKRIGENLQNRTSQRPEYDGPFHQAICDEIARRAKY